MNLKTIADALAARFVNVVATNGTETETASATADLPNQIAKLALLVYPPDGDLNIVIGPRLDDQYDFAVRLLRDPLDVPSRSRWLYAWATALRTKVQQNIDLDIVGVTQAQAVSMRVAIDGERYAPMVGRTAPFDVVELIVRVWILENTTASI